MYQLAQSNLWTGRLDSETDPRHFQTVKFGDLSQLDFSDEHKGVGLLGYAIDKGVELNKGRVGAKKVPMPLSELLLDCQI